MDSLADDYDSLLGRVSTTRRQRERFIAKGMFAEMYDTPEHGAQCGAPCIVLDVNMVGIGLLCDQDKQVGDRVFISMTFDGLAVRKVPGVVRHVQRVKELILRVGIEFEQSTIQYKVASQELSSMEVLCIEKGMEFDR